MSGKREDVVGVDRGDLGERPRARERGDPVARRERRSVRRLPHRARELGAHRVRQLRPVLVEALGLQDVREVHPDRGDVDEHLLRCARRLRNVAHLDRSGPVQSHHLYCTHAVTVPAATTSLITSPGDPRSAAGGGSRQGAPVQLVFGPDDLEAYADVRDRLRLHIVAWARRRGLLVEPSLVAAALDHKHSVDGRLGHWTRAHVADALAVWFPRTVALLPDDRDAVPAALHALIGFLAERDWLDSRSDPAEELHTQVGDSTPALHDALDDERNHDLGTFWAVQMLRHGVPTADPSAVARFLERVHAGDLDIDRAALRDITRRECRAAPEPPGVPLPPVLLPGAAAMLAAADSSIALARLRGFTRWVRAGRALTRDGRLQLGDARAVAEALDLDHFARDRARAGDELPEIMLLFSWARQARFVRVVHGRLVQVKSAAPLLSRPIEMWKRAFEAIGGIGEHFGGSNVFGAPSLFGMSLGEAFPMLLTLLYAAGGEPIPVERFHRSVREAVNARMGCVVDDLAGDVEQRLWRRDVTALLDALELLGAVHLEESHADDDDDHRALIALAGPRRPGSDAGRAHPDRAVGGAGDARRVGRARAARGRTRRRGHRVRLRALRRDAPRGRRGRARGLGGGPSEARGGPRGAAVPAARRGPDASRPRSVRARPDRHRRTQPRRPAPAPGWAPRRECPATGGVRPPTSSFLTKLYLQRQHFAGRRRFHP